MFLCVSQRPAPFDIPRGLMMSDHIHKCRSSSTAQSFFYSPPYTYIHIVHIYMHLRMNTLVLFYPLCNSFAYYTTPAPDRHLVGKLEHLMRKVPFRKTHTHTHTHTHTEMRSRKDVRRQTRRWVRDGVGSRLAGLIRPPTITPLGRVMAEEHRTVLQDRWSGAAFQEWKPTSCSGFLRRHQIQTSNFQGNPAERSVTLICTSSRLHFSEGGAHLRACGYRSPSVLRLGSWYAPHWFFFLRLLILFPSILNPLFIDYLNVVGMYCGSAKWLRCSVC